ncbi:UDP-glucose 4-epimerase [Lachnospiraceae bacterium XBD2001]|nr:UDP-glucose 4-epimerase [Lachnospiraceae bacterium XBD2001]
MKRILITGKNSYIGTKVEEWLSREPEKYQIETLDMQLPEWRKREFSQYDVVFHVAGIAHRKNVPDDLYDEVNHKLAVEVANKAVTDGVKHFVFMSSGAVFSQSDRNHKSIIVDENSPLEPNTMYGISKMRAEQGLQQLSNRIMLAIIRPPMVYGPGAKGNYNPLAKLAKKIPFFPRIDNARSMIYIDNLCEFIRLVIDSDAQGVFLPQNAEYVNTSNLVAEIARVNHHKVWMNRGLNWAVLILGKRKNVVNKVFGSYCYAKTDYFDNKYQLVGFRDSIEATEGVEK